MNKEVLIALRDRVAAATGPDRKLDADIWVSTKADDRPGCVERPNGRCVGEVFDTVEWDWKEAPRLTASIDAALAFKDRVQRGWDWRVERSGPVHHRGEVWECGCQGVTSVVGLAPTAPLAIILAVLDALIEGAE